MLRKIDKNSFRGLEYFPTEEQKIEYSELTTNTAKINYIAKLIGLTE